MSFSPPFGVTFHISDEIPVAALSTLLQRVIAFLQNLQLSPPRLRLYHDWWQHDGMHFDKGAVTLHDVFAMVETPRAIFEATPEDHQVFVGIAPQDGAWYLRFRAEWDNDNRSIVGTFAVTLPPGTADEFRREIAALSEHPLVEESSDGYYRSVMK